MRPMLATPADAVPPGDRWRHEVKWDGMRLLVHVRDGRVRLTSRTEREVGAAFPELLAAQAGLAGAGEVVLDGEVVCLRGGRPSFAALADRFTVTDPAVGARLAARSPVTLMVFDLLHAGGTDLLDRPLHERRRRLEELAADSPWVQLPPVFADGPALAAATAEQGLEGVVSKALDSPYRPGRRSPDWVKTVHRHTDSFVVGAWRPEVGGARLGGLLLGSPGPRGLVFRGRMGSGLAGRAGDELLGVLQDLAAARSPFASAVPAADRRGARWVRPRLVVDVQFHGSGSEGRLRHPTWRGIRHDLTPDDLLDAPDDRPGERT